MKIRPILVLCALVVVSGCTGDPEPLPVEPPAPARPPAQPQPVPQVQPEPEPLPEGHAPLVGTRWDLATLYGDMRTLIPPDGPVWLEFRPDGTFFVQGPENTIEGTFTYRPDEASPKSGFDFEEGRLEGYDVLRNRRPGTFSDFEDVLLENLALLKGYYIRGETHGSSTLTIWGGYRSEEVLLLELDAAP